MSEQVTAEAEAKRKEEEDFAKLAKSFDAAPKLSQSTFMTIMTIKMALESSGLDTGQKKDVCYAAMDMHTAFVVKNTLENLAKAILSVRGTDPKMVLALLLEESIKRFDKAARKCSMLLGMLGESLGGDAKDEAKR